MSEVVNAIRAELGDAVTVARRDARSLDLTFRDHEDAVVSVTLEDTERPSFEMTYPHLAPTAGSLLDAQDTTASRVLVEGLLGIICSVARHGVVPPEFPSEHVRRQLRWGKRRSSR